MPGFSTTCILFIKFHYLTYHYSPSHIWLSRMKTSIFAEHSPLPLLIRLLVLKKSMLGSGNFVSTVILEQLMCMVNYFETAAHGDISQWIYWEFRNSVNLKVISNFGISLYIYAVAIYSKNYVNIRKEIQMQINLLGLRREQVKIPLPGS